MRFILSKHSEVRGRERFGWSEDEIASHAQQALQAVRARANRGAGLYIRAALDHTLVKVFDGIIYIFSQKNDGWELITLFPDKEA